MNEMYFDEQEDVFAGLPNPTIDDMLVIIEQQYEIHLINEELANDKSE